MQRWRFFLANVLSGIGWSVLYLTPGILIGAASTDLSSEDATFVFGMTLCALTLIWLGGMVLKHFFGKIRTWWRKRN